MGIKLHPIKLEGRWRNGWALDLHTISSKAVGENAYGHMQFETERPEIAELLHQLKYRYHKDAAGPIIEAVIGHVKPHLKHSQLLVPVPPSKLHRPFQPVLVLGEGIAKGLGLPFHQCVKKIGETQQLKNVTDAEERKKLLDGAFDIDPTVTKGKKVLLFDDLYRSGSTLNAVTEVLLGKGEAAEVYVLTVTKARSNK